MSLHVKKNYVLCWVYESQEDMHVYTHTCMMGVRIQASAFKWYRRQNRERQGPKQEGRSRGDSLTPAALHPPRGTPAEAKRSSLSHHTDWPSQALAAALQHNYATSQGYMHTGEENCVCLYWNSSSVRETWNISSVGETWNISSVGTG